MAKPLSNPSVDPSAALVRDLHLTNPWWEGRALPELPATRQQLVEQIHLRLRMRLAPAVVVWGPRETGKTTAQLQVLADLLDRGVPPLNIFRVEIDTLRELDQLSEPILRLVDWYEDTILQTTLNAVAHRGEPTYLFFDEIQRLRNWGPQMKFLVDHTTTQVVIAITGIWPRIEREYYRFGRAARIDAGVLP